MNNKQIQDLTRHLSQALDQNYDVVNMDTVLAVISTLEGTIITKEQLEATRLAKYINHLRRRTNNEHLARRAKSLLKKWREMVGMQQQQQLPFADTQQHTSTTTLSTTTSPPPAIFVQSASVNLTSGNVLFAKTNQNQLQQQGSHSTTTSPTNSRSETVARLSLLHTTTSMPTTRVVDMQHTNRLQSTEPPPPPHRQKATAASTSGVVEIAAAAVVNAQNKQPTNFTNLFTNLKNNSSNNLKRQSSSAGLLYSSSSNSAASSFTKQHEQQQKQSAETLVIDHSSSNSNSTTHFIAAAAAHRNQSKLNADAGPIVIDIDSDSADMDSIVMLQSQQKSHRTTSVGSVASLPISSSACQAAAAPPNVNKSKKSKKDKKRKEKDNNYAAKKDLLFTTHNTYSAVNTADEFSNTKEQYSPQKVFRPKNTEDEMLLDSFRRGGDQQQNYATTISNMSEILTLSNSSMSSMFPGENNLKAAASVSNVSSLGANKIRSLDSDLTFTGKFKSTTGGGDCATNYMNSINGRREINVSSDSTPPVIEKQVNAAPARSATYGNENSSTSSSRVFPFDDMMLIDVVGSSRQHDKNHLKLFNEQRLRTSGNVVSSDSTANERTMAATHETDFKDGGGSVAGAATTAATSSNSKSPKKRGRKKGSKGVDAIIAHETSLSQQIFGSSGGKKVKTTKELFNEIKNRKLATSTTSTPTDQQQQKKEGIILSKSTQQHYQKKKTKTMMHVSRPTSSCSEASMHHSPHTMDAACLTNNNTTTPKKTERMLRSSSDNSNQVEDAAASDSYDTTTSDASNDDETTNQLELKRSSNFIDSSSNSQQFNSAGWPKPLHQAFISGKTTVKMDTHLKEFLKALPPPNSRTALEIAYAAQLVPCTCILIEEDLQTNMKETNNDENAIAPECDILKNNNTSVQAQLIAELEIDGVEGTQLANTIEKVPQSTTPADNTAQEAVFLVHEKPKKSIFDLDFDEDDDPLQSLIAETAAAAATARDSKSVDRVLLNIIGTVNISENIQNGEDKHTSAKAVLHLQNMEQEQHDEAAVDENIELMPHCLYRVEEDVNCAAKHRYNIQTNKITKFHVDNLHNCYIPNINGNWDDAAEDYFETQKVFCNADASDGTDVVPQYGCLIKERIPKDLSNFTFQSQVKKMMRFRNVPFLGVAKCLPSCRKHNRRILKKKITLRNANQTSSKNQKINVDISGDCKDLIVQKQEEDTQGSVNNIDKNCSDALKVVVPLCELANGPMVEQVTNFAVVEGGADCTSHDLLLAIANDETETPLSVAQTKVEVPQFTLKAEDEEAENFVNEEEQQQQKQVNSSTSTSLALICNSQEQLDGQITHSLTTLENWDKPTMMTSSPSPAGSRRSSSCSNSSLRKTQNSINEKLRHQRLLFTQQQQQQQRNVPCSDNVTDDDDLKLTKRKRKKRRRHNSSTRSDGDVQDCDANENKNQKETKNKKVRRQPRIKRIRIAINGEVATQRQISNVSSSNNNSTTEDDENEDYEFSHNDVASVYSGEHRNAYGNQDDSFRENNGTTGDSDSDSSNDDDDNDVSNVSNSDSDDNSNSLKSHQYNLDQDQEEYDEEDRSCVVNKTCGNDYDDFKISSDAAEDVNDAIGEYAIVQRQPVNDDDDDDDNDGGGRGVKKHIVLTIKKTPSKMNSPANSLSSISPLLIGVAATTTSVVDDDDIIINSSINNNNTNVAATKASRSSSPWTGETSSTKSKSCEVKLAAKNEEKLREYMQNENKPNKQQTSTENMPARKYQSIRRLRRRKPKPKLKSREPCVELELKKLFGSLESTAAPGQKQLQLQRQQKRHQKLFFTDELYVRSNTGRQLRILNCSSCSSSCAEEESSSDYDTSSASEMQQHYRVITETKIKLNKWTEAGAGSALQTNIDALPKKASDCKVDDDSCSSDSIMSSSSSSSSPSDSEEISNTCGEMQLKLKDDHMMHFDYQCDLALTNNGLLETFNDIYPKDCCDDDDHSRIDNDDDDIKETSLCANVNMNVDKLQQLNCALQNKNCDDYNNLYNNNNNNNLNNVIKNNLVNNCNYNKKNTTSSEDEEIVDAGAVKTELVLSVATAAETNVVEEGGVVRTTNKQQQLEAATRVKPFSEYSTGIRYVKNVEKADGNGMDGGTRLQQFKEWHQVLQLRSYNDELLTVLPYVLLE